jgi:hypothetical protein
MAHRGDEPQNRDSTTSNAESKTAALTKYELPIDLDDIIGVAILDSALRVKQHRKWKRRGAARRPRQ